MPRTRKPIRFPAIGSCLALAWLASCGAGNAGSVAGARQPWNAQAQADVPLYVSQSEYALVPALPPACTQAKTVFRSKSEVEDAGIASSIPSSVDFGEKMVAQDVDCGDGCGLLVMQPPMAKAQAAADGAVQHEESKGDGWIEVRAVLPDPCCIGPHPGEEFFEKCHAVRYGVLAILPASDAPVCFTYRTEICLAM